MASKIPGTMGSTTQLVGPPELAHYKPGTAVLGMTENQSATYLTSLSPLLDFFFQVVPGTPTDRVHELLEKAWRRDPLMALKLVAQLRGIKGTGKSDRNGFYAAATWIFKHHPATLIRNARILAGQFGYLKDLLELLLRPLQTEDEIEDKIRFADVHRAKMRAAKKRPKWSKDSKERVPDPTLPRRRGSKKGYFARKGAAAREAKANGVVLPPSEERIAADKLKGKELHEAALVARKERRLYAANRALSMYQSDENYRSLHDEVAQMFADMLANDMEMLKSGNKRGISLAAKWCPSLDSSYDRSTLLCENIAKRLFPDVTGDNAHNVAYRARERLRKEALVPIRRALELPEVFMSANAWGQVNYKRVASVAMKNYKDIFMEHDRENFEKFLEDVKSGKKKIASGALLPHQIIESALSEQNDENKTGVAELQWKSMVEKIKSVGVLQNSIAVCDVSGSMAGIPMTVCIALGILVSELCDEPWKGRVITFSENPELHRIEGETLVEKHTFTERMNWGYNTDFQKVFDRILDLAKDVNLPADKMIKQLLVFSDMEFDQASANPWETDYMVIKKKFADAGYGTPPKIIFWNLRDSRSTPVLQDQEGVSMVSGFSKNLLSLFLKGEDYTPLTTMYKAIQGDLFDQLVIVD